MEVTDDIINAMDKMENITNTPPKKTVKRKKRVVKRKKKEDVPDLLSTIANPDKMLDSPVIPKSKSSHKKGGYKFF